MLLRFAATNYRSIKKTAILSMAANPRIKKFKSSHTIDGENKINKVAYIYGGNASGKSNLIKAVDFSRRIILNDLENISTFNQHFRLDKESYEKPGAFQYDMVINNKTYSYGFAFSYISRTIVEEWLYEVKQSGKDICIFERDDKKGVHKSDIKLNGNDEVAFNVYKNSILNLNSKLFLKRVSENIGNEKSKLSIFSDVYNWFKKVQVIFPDTVYANLINLVGNNDEIREQFEEYLRDFDTGIESIEQKLIENEDIIDVLKREMPESIAKDIMKDVENILKDEKQEIKLNSNKANYTLKIDDALNKIYLKQLLYNHGNSDDLFEAVSESDGTRRLFDLLPIMLGETDENVFFIDEIDRSLHPNLAVAFMELFYKVMEKKKTQLILTTHEDCLLNQDRIRKDEVWAVVRDEDKSTSLYPLDKYDIRSDANIQKGYLLGIYGGVPKLEID